ncbi:MAG TPA: VWA domain-containing protein, partial [Thermoplasmatales archaeon]|nr:VWA domain-containing protein [Thermoplasmatales archaeon]
MANDSMGNQGTNDTLMPPDNQTAGNIVMNFVIDTPITVKNVGDPHHSHPNYGYYPDYGSNEFYYVTLDTPFSFTATDNDGINATYYRIWYNGSWHPEPGTGIGKGHNFSLYTGTFTLGDFPWAGEGQYYIEFYSDDNNETIQGVEYTHGQWHDVDETKPAYDVWFDDPHSIIHGLDAINCSNAMWVLLYDTGICQSGVEWFNYSVYWNPDEPSGYDWLYDFSIHDNDINDYDDRDGYILARLTFDEECFHEIKWRVTDYVGNYGIYDRDIAVDCTEPVITKEFVGPTVDGYLPSPYGEPVWTPNLWLTNHTVIWLNATDLGCGGGAGVCKLGYWIDWNDDLNGSWDDTKYEPVVVPDNSPLDKDPTVGNISVNLTFKYDCVHEIHYWAVDCVGNNFTHKQKHFVDNTPPVIRKDIEKVNMLEQIYWNDSAIVTSVIDDFQSFLAPWSYVDAVSVFVCGYFDPEYPPVLMIWNETMEDILAYGYPVEIPVNDNYYYCGWLQFHLTNRLYTDVGGLYWVSVMQNQSTDYIFYWEAYNSYYDGKDKYPDGHAYVNGIENTSWDFTFKIEYYPYHPYIYPFSYTFYNRTISWDGLNGTWVTSKAFFKLTTWDEWCMGGVGVKSLKYRIWWNGTWTPWMNYTQPFNLTEECTHYIEIMAEDLLGNVRIINQTHYVDNSPPDLNVEYPDEHGFYYDNETGKMFVRAGKTFYLNLTDLPECAVGWRDFVFYWRYDYTNFTTPYLEEHPVDENDTEYGTPVFIDGKWWWVQEPGIPSVNLSFDRECRHRIYYFYEASDWLDNSIVTDVEMEEIYVDAYDPVVDKEEPWHHYYEEDTIYLHSDPPINPLDMFMGPPMYTSWHELYPEYGNYYTWTGYTWIDWKGTYYYNMTDEEGEEDMYEFIDATITLLLSNDTYGEMYVELYGDYMWDTIMFDPNSTMWHEVYPSFSNLYMIVNWTDNGDHVLGYCDYVLMINETDNESIWHVEEVSVDLLLKPVPFMRACGRINMSAKDMPDLLKVVDQAQTDGPLQDTIQVYNPVTTPWPWDAQSFKPNASYINSTKLYLNWSAPAEVTVYIHNASSWTPATAIASSTVTLNTSGEGWVEFVFNPGIPVTPNETYYMEVHRSSSSGLVHWYYYAGDDTSDAYKRGNATISGEEENQTEKWDWKFQVLYWRDNPCASGIEGIYYGYYYNGEWYPRDENDTTEYHTEIVDISIYYNDTVINEDFGGIYLWYVYNDSIGIHFNESCVHDLYYWTKDNVCHHSEIHYKRYRVDKEEPEVTIEFPDHGYASTYGAGKADIVFVVDTSGSMYDVWTTLDDKMDGLKQQLISQGLDVNVTVYGLASNPSSLNYSYAMTTVWFNGTNVSLHDVSGPGNPNQESWGPGTSWCALWYPWREGATRIVIPISDECAYDGETTEDANDAFAVDEAKSLCQNNSVIVFPFYHTQFYGSIPEVIAEMEEIANATGGEVNDITELENFSAIFLDIITGAVVKESLRCGAQISLSAVDKPLEETKLIDQIQPVGDYPYPINSQPFTTMQSFIPTVDRLDAVSLLLNATYDEVNVSIYDEGFNLLGWNITVVYTWYPAWYQFHFDPINLTPGKTYYIVVTSDYPYHYWWFTNDSYECGHAYMNGEWAPEYDFAFKTEYYGYGEGMCASGIEGIYWRYEYNGTSYPYEMGDGVINLSNYYPDEPDIANYLWYVYNESNGIVFTEECQHDLYYFAKDNVCHHTEIYHRTFFVDNSLPEINKTHPEHGYEVFPEGFLFEEYFDDGMTGWTDTDGAWDTWSSNNAGGIAPEAEGEWLFFKDGSMLISPPIDTSGYREATLSFKTYVDNYDGINHSYTLHAQISSDGTTWEDIWNITPTYDYGPVTVTTNLTWMDGIGSSTFYIAFVYTGDPYGIDYWYIDNVTLYGYKAEHLRAGANITLFADDMPEGNCSAGTILKWRFENETGYYPLYYFEGFEDGWLPTDWKADGCFVW